MNKGSDIKNRVKFRLTGTPDGDLLVTFYHLDVFNESAVNYHIATQFLGGQFGRKVLYEGNLQNNTHYQSAIYRLAERIELYVNCVRIERLAQAYQARTVPQIVSFDTTYPNRKDWRKPYRRAKRFDRTCRNHGSCSYCRDNRLHRHHRRDPLELRETRRELAESKAT